MAQTHSWDIDITGAGDICQWITDKGGPYSLTGLDVLHCYQAKLYGPPQGDVTFTPTYPQVLYVYQYFIATTPEEINIINIQSGCNFGLNQSQYLYGTNDDNDNFITLPVVPMTANSLEINDFCWKEGLIPIDILEWTIAVGNGGIYTQIGWGVCDTVALEYPTYGCITPCQLPCVCDPNPLNFQEQQVDELKIHMWSNLPLSGMKPNSFSGWLRVN